MDRTKSLAALLPLAMLGLALLVMLFIAIPPSNREVVVSVVSGLLGYVAKPDRSGGEDA